MEGFEILGGLVGQRKGREGLLDFEDDIHQVEGIETQIIDKALIERHLSRVDFEFGGDQSLEFEFGGGHSVVRWLGG